MSERVALLVGTRKGLFVLDGDADRAGLAGARPALRRLADPRRDLSTPASGAIYAGGGSNWYGPAVWRSDDLGETWSHSSEGLTYGDDGPKVTTVWNVTAGPDALYAGVEPAGLFRSARRRRDVGARRGPHQPPEPAGVAAGQRRPDPPLDRPPPRRHGSGLGRHLVRRRVRDAATAARPGRPATRASAPTSTRRTIIPGLRPVRAQARDGRGRRRAPLPAEPLRRVPLGRRRRASGRRSRRACRPSSASRWPPTRATRRRSGRSR